MSRKVRSCNGSNYFHVMVQGINKEFIFNSNKDKEKYQSLIYDYIKLYNIEIIAHCIMSNHSHLLIYTSHIHNLISFMHRINTNYAYYYNQKVDRVGYVFRDRYKTEEIYSNSHLLNCILYIHNNPVNANICSNASQYKYSSYSNYINNINLMNKYFFKDINDFKKLHLICNNMSFMDIDKKDVKQLISLFCIQNNTTLDKIKSNKKLLIALIIYLKEKNKTSLRKISNKLKIDRRTLKHYINNNS